MPDSSPIPLERDRPLRVSKEIPLWGIVTVLAALGGQAVALYYGQQGLTKEVTQLTGEVRELRVSAQRYELERERARLATESLERRLGDIEARLNGVSAPVRSVR